jgi:hypothetical protein
LTASLEHASARLRDAINESRRLASGAPLPPSLALPIEAVEMTYGLPRSSEFHRSGLPSERYRGYRETNYPEVLRMQEMLFRRSRAVDHLLGINHNNYREWPITCPEDAFLVMCALLAHCDRDTEAKRLMVRDWVRSVLPAHGVDERYTEVVGVLGRFARTATIGSLPRGFLSA